MQNLRGSGERRTEFAQRMRQARTHAAISQKDAATAIGISQPTLSKLESSAIGSSFTPAAAVVYGASATWLQAGTGGMLDGVTPLSERAAYVAGLLDGITDPAAFDRACILCETFAALAQAGQLQSAIGSMLERSVPGHVPTDAPPPGRQKQTGAGPPKRT